MSLIVGESLSNLDGPILVTGHTGFKGTWLTLLLENLNLPIIGLSLDPQEDSLYTRLNRKNKISEEYIDIRDLEGVGDFLRRYRPSAIIHMAAQPLVLESYRKPRDTFEVNVMGTHTVLESAFELDCVKAVLVVTTDKVYRNDNSGEMFIESDPLKGKDPYSASKVATESVVSAWQQIVKLRGGPKITAVRAGNVIGGGDWSENRLLPDIVRAATENRVIQLRNPSSSRPWQHVLDPLTGYLMLLEKLVTTDFTADSMNFGPKGMSLTVKQVVDIFSRSWPHQLDVSILTQENYLEAESLVLNSDFAASSLGWKQQWSQEMAVESTASWWRHLIVNGVDAHTLCQNEIAQILEVHHG
jgi:CDP-glucose 4,6-dehydratase